MAGEDETITVYGTKWCPDCRRAKQFLGEQRVHYHGVDIEHDEEGMAYVQRVTRGARRIPVLAFPDGTHLIEPTNAELASKLGLPLHAQRTFYDVIVVGGGPAGLATAIYTSREGLDTLVIERNILGGQASITQVIDNYPGFDEGISGEEFGRRLVNQARRFGTEVLQTQAVRDVRENGRYRDVLTSDGTRYSAYAVLIATGARYRSLRAPGETELTGVSVHFCATCDGAFYRDKDVLVVGGGNSAFEEGLFLTRFARHVTIATHGPDIKASQILQDKVAGRDDMTVYRNRAVQRFLLSEDGQLSVVEVMNRDTGVVETWHPDGVFVFIGMVPNSTFLPPEIERDDYGFVLTAKGLETSMSGVFAAGDVRAGATSQATSAAGEGAAAALMIREYIQRWQE